MQTTALQPTPLRPPQHINLFGRQMASRRAELGYTQEEFTHHLQSDAVLVGMWERGARLPTIKTLPQIARTCKWPLQRAVEWHLADLLVNSPYSQDLTQENFRLAAGTVFQGIGKVLCSNALGDYLKALRENHGKTQDEVALEVKIDPTTLSKIETGRNFPKPANLSALAHYYEEPLENLVAAFLVTQGIQEYGNYPLNLSLLFKEVAKQALNPENIKTRLTSNALGDYLKALRENHGKTQDEVALEAKVDRRILSQIEIGRIFPEPANLSALAEWYEEPLENLVAAFLVTQGIRKYGNYPLNFSLVFEQISKQALNLETMNTGLTSNVLGDYLKVLRESHGKTQSQVALLVKITQETLSAIEIGRIFPEPANLSALAEWYEEPLENLVAAFLVTQGIRKYGNYPLNLSLLFKEVAKQALNPENIKIRLTSNALGDYLKALRENHGKTQDEVALEVKIAQITLSAIETGKNFPEPVNLLVLAQVYEEPLENLVAALLVTQGIREYGNYPLNTPLLFEQISKQALNPENIKTRLTSNALGDYLKALRENHGKTQDEIARQVKITQKTLSRIEAGQSFPEPSNLSALAEVYDKPLPQLAGLCLATQAVVDYGIFSEINLQAAWETALSLIPPSLRCGLKSIEPLLEGKPQFLLAKISNLLQEQGISLKDHSKIKQIARAAKISVQPFLEFVQGKRSLGEFLYSSSGDGEVIQNLAQALKYDAANLVGYLGIDLAYAEEVRGERSPSYVSNDGKGVDLESVDLDGRKRKTEVKAMSTISPALRFTEKEWETANRRDERYYLLVILNAATEEPTFFSLEGPLDYLEAREYGLKYYVSIKDIFAVARAQGHCLEPFPVGKIEISRP